MINNVHMYDILIVITLLNPWKFCVSGIFQKPPGRRWTAARRLIHLHVFWVPRRGTAWQQTHGR